MHISSARQVRRAGVRLSPFRCSWEPFRDFGGRFGLAGSVVPPTPQEDLSGAAMTPRHCLTQALFRQTWPAPQRVPQPPQFFSSLRRSTQRPLHLVRRSSHRSRVQRQVPRSRVVPAGHFARQTPPQICGLSGGHTQRQRIWDGSKTQPPPPGQRGRHLPPHSSRSAAQPQRPGSTQTLVGSEAPPQQTPPQHVWSGWQQATVALPGPKQQVPSQQVTNAPLARQGNSSVPHCGQVASAVTPSRRCRAVVRSGGQASTHCANWQSCPSPQQTPPQRDLPSGQGGRTQTGGPTGCSWQTSPSLQQPPLRPSGRQQQVLPLGQPPLKHGASQQMWVSGFTHVTPLAQHLRPGRQQRLSVQQVLVRGQQTPPQSFVSGGQPPCAAARRLVGVTAARAVPASTRSAARRDPAAPRVWDSRSKVVGSMGHPFRNADRQATEPS